jgi:exosortase A
VIALFAVAAVCWGPFVSLVSIWRRSQTFAHCFAILPICLFLIWRMRHALERAAFRPSALGLLAVIALSLGWLLASAAEVQVGQQLTAVLLLPAVVVSIIGIDAAGKIAFPLAYLLFAVPFGEGLLPGLMDFTATFTVGALRLTGIPVLREGFYFSIPKGNFEVAQACSGLRYLIACAAIGILYSYLSYRSWKKRAVFIAVSLVAPIIANGVRAYGIVMIAHLSDMKLATGVDHLVYGWLFFAVLVFSMFWVASHFQDPPEGSAPAVRSRFASTGPAAPVCAAILAVLFAALGPSWLVTVQARAEAAPVSPVHLPGLVSQWHGPEPTPMTWSSAAPVLHGRYSSGNVAVDVNIVTAMQLGADELIGYLARTLQQDRAQVIEPQHVIRAGDRTVAETVIRTPDGTLILWHWYRIGASAAAEDWHAKLLEAWNKVVHGRSDGALVVLSTRDTDRQTARERLRRFAGDAWIPIQECLQSTSSE